MNRYNRKTGNTNSISSWESKGLSDEVFKPPIKNNSLAPKLEYINERMFAKFDGSCLIKRGEFTFNKKAVNIYIVYHLDTNLNNFDPTLENCLFGAIKTSKSSDMSECNCSGYGIGGTFLHPTGSFGINAIIFGADVSSSTHPNNRVNNILVLGKDFIQGINGKTIYAEKCIQLILVQLRLN